MTQKIAQTPDDLCPLDRMLSMSGLEFVQGMLDGSVAAAPIAGLLDYRLHSVEDGRVAFRGAPEFRSLNPMGTLHGGWYGTLLDSAMGCAVMTRVPRGSAYTTLEYKINITRAIPLGTEIEALGWVRHSGRTTGVAAGEIRGIEDGMVYATGSTTCLIMPMR